jgi:F-type H+-transporting ATPase subunit b
MDVDFNHIITQILAFLVMLWVLKKFCWVPLLSLLQERREHIISELKEVAEKKAVVNHLVEDYQNKLKGIESEARVKIQEAISEGRKIGKAIQEEAQMNAKEILIKNQAEIQKQIDSAKSQLRSDVINLAITISEKVLHQKLDESEHKRLITDFIQEAELK